MAATISPIETMTASVESYKAIIRDAVRIPAPGIFKSYQTIEYDDFGNKMTVIIRSTEYVSESGEITWSQAVVTK